MSPDILFKLLTLLVAAIGAIAAISAYVRAGRWRDSDDGKAVKDDIHAIKNELMKIDGRLNRAEDADKDLPNLGDRVTAIETTLKSVASSADIRELQGEMAGINRSVNNIQESTRRIEGWLMEGRGQ